MMRHTRSPSPPERELEPSMHEQPTAATTPTIDAASATIVDRTSSMNNGDDDARTSHELSAARSSDATAARARAGWFVGPLFLAATVTGVIFVIRGPDRFFGLALGALIVLALTWIVISALFPAKADRTCPSCGAKRLQRIDARTTRGVVCDACGHADPDQSSFLMAEEEGPLEKIVLAERSSAHRSTIRAHAEEKREQRP